MRKFEDVANLIDCHGAQNIVFPSLTGLNVSEKKCESTSAVLNSQLNQIKVVPFSLQAQSIMKMLMLMIEVMK